VTANFRSLESNFRDFFFRSRDLGGSFYSGPRQIGVKLLALWLGTWPRGKSLYKIITTEELTILLTILLIQRQGKNEQVRVNSLGVKLL
jgi:hypothetical protein